MFGNNAPFVYKAVSLIGVITALVVFCSDSDDRKVAPGIALVGVAAALVVSGTASIKK